MGLLGCFSFIFVHDILGTKVTKYLKRLICFYFNALNKLKRFCDSVFVGENWTKINKNGWKNTFQNIPRKKFILIQLPELLMDQNEVTIFGFLIEFYVKFDLSKFVRHLLDHPNLEITGIRQGKKLLHTFSESSEEWVWYFILEGTQH